MSMHEKILKAKSTEWLTEGLSKPEIKSNIELAKISARLEMKRIDLGMTQKEFAEYMGVSQGMVSKWESREYNFTIATLNDICEKLGLIFDPIIREPDEIPVEHIQLLNKSKARLRKNKKAISG
ncbi:MAG: helix-turn-helix domain-containing protein [Lachnospiraceae bacterium]|nr:helix-turn-helix domain-containing protein [Lachnospiraceae bacterium]